MPLRSSVMAIYNTASPAMSSTAKNTTPIRNHPSSAPHTEDNTRPSMATLRRSALHLIMVALAILCSAAMSYVFSPGGLGPRQQQQQPQIQQQEQQAAAPSPPAGHVLPPLTAELCVSVDAENPIKDLYPMNATGVLNATLAVFPITIEAARRIIPAQYAILERPLRALLPDFPQGMYPVLVQAAHDHEVGLHGIGFTIPDFSRVGFEFPFLDLLGDGYSSFRWAPMQFLSADNEIAMEGSRAYGTVVHPADFDPPCDAFRRGGADGEALQHFSAWSSSPASSLTLEFARAGGASSYPEAFFRNITNQPSFVDGRSCDQMVRLFNTSLAAGGAAWGGVPTPIRGTVSAANVAPFGDVDRLEVEGIHVVTAFVENNYLDCRSLQGYVGTGDQ